jgi:hypothetical protein
MTLALSPSLKTARLTALLDVIETGNGAAQLTFYGGAQPEPGGTPVIGIAQSWLNYPCGTIQDNVLTLALPDTIVASASGTITWARLTNMNGDWVIDMSVSDSPGADLVMSPVDVIVGGLINFITKTISE